MKADKNLIEWLLTESGVSRYAVSKATGIAQTTLSDLATGKTSIDKMTLGHAITLTEYAEKLQDERRGLNTLWYNDNGTYHRIYEVISDKRMGVDDLLEFSGLTMARIAELLDFDDADYECLTTEK